MTTQIVIEGQTYDASTLTQPASGRMFRDAWAAPVDNVIQLDATKLHALMAVKVQEERARRLQIGFNYDFGDARGVHEIGTTDADWVGWNEVINLANALIDSGSGSTTIDVVTNTGPVTVTALEWQAIMLAGAGSRQTIWAKSFALQAMDPIPEDYNADNHWS
jgi:hypothetical protein